MTLPPSASGLAAYNIGHQLTGAAISGITTGLVINGTTQVAVPASIAVLTPKEAYEAFTRKLAAIATREQFYRKFYLPYQRKLDPSLSDEYWWKKLDRELRITVPTKPNDFTAKVTIEGNDPTLISEWANSYVALAYDAAQRELMNNLAGEVQVRMDSINEQIATVRDIAMSVRSSEISRLKEAIKIARAINLESSDVFNESGKPIYPLRDRTTFLLGTDTLLAELKALEQRTNDDPFIPELPDLLKKKALLKSINVDSSKLSVATIDREASPPSVPIKPKTSLIIFLGISLGGVLGIFIAIVRLKIKNKF